MGTVNNELDSTGAAICRGARQEVCHLRDNKTSDCKSNSWLIG